MELQKTKKKDADLLSDDSLSDDSCHLKRENQGAKPRGFGELVLRQINSEHDSVTKSKN